MRFYHTVFALPAALTSLKWEVWAVWLCLTGMPGYRLLTLELHGGSEPGLEHKWINCENSRFEIRMKGNIREGPD